jgi:eukaryotic-like serine/threonine-protein kinase
MINPSVTPCDEQRLRTLLNAEEDTADFRTAAEHVESCPRCQSRLSDLAASGDEWAEASRLLAEDEGDADLTAELPARPWKADHAAAATTWTETMARQLLSAPSHPEMLGRLGRYEIERMIGSGGMGIVFKGFDTELNRPVAIKVLAPHLAGSGAARKRFAREARAAAAVVHEHVVAIHNVESDGAAPFLVMQFVAGESLQARLDRQGPLELCEILRIGRQTAAGLAAAHAQGLVHRDVKPSNILLEHGVERALLTDFGLARACDDASLTHTGHMPGTPHYMSPEQARGESIDARSDLFSLGSVCMRWPPAGRRFGPTRASASCGGSPTIPRGRSAK